MKVYWEDYSGEGISFSSASYKNYLTIGIKFSLYDLEKEKISLKIFERGVSGGLYSDFNIFSMALKANLLLLTPLSATYEDLNLRTSSKFLSTLSLSFNLKLLEISKVKFYLNLEGEAGFYSHYKGLLGLNILL